MASTAMATPGWHCGNDQEGEREKGRYNCPTHTTFTSLTEHRPPVKSCVNAWRRRSGGRGGGGPGCHQIWEQAHASSDNRSPVSATDHPSFIKDISTSARRRSTRPRRLTPTYVPCPVRRSPSRRSRMMRTSLQSAKCRRSSSYRSSRLRATTKMSTYQPRGLAPSAHL